MTRYQRLRAQGKCVSCGELMFEASHVRCEKCREIYRVKMQDKREKERKSCTYPDCFNCPKDDCTRVDFGTGVEKDAFNIRQRYERS